jgi:hypothetical protein
MQGMMCVCVCGMIQAKMQKNKSVLKTTFQGNICGPKTPSDELSNGDRIMKSLFDIINGTSSSRRFERWSHCRHWSCWWRENCKTQVTSVPKVATFVQCLQRLQLQLQLQLQYYFC